MGERVEVSLSTLKNRDNNFDFLRQFAAFLVIVGHSESLTGSSHSGFWGVSVSTFGIQVFLAVSGYLVTESWMNSRNLSTFIRKRISRIFPGLIVCILLTTFVLGPSLTSLTAKEYFSHDGTYLYLNNILLYPVYSLPGVFESNTYPNAVNGSLWSLPVEFACYIVIASVGLLLGRQSPLFAIISSFVMIIYANLVLVSHSPVVIWGSPLREAFEVMPFFFAGCFFRLLPNGVVFRTDLVIIAVACLTAVSLLRPELHWCINWILVTYVILCFGVSRSPVIGGVGRWGDPSYGMYLYAFPIQQTLQYLSGNQMTLSGMVWITTALSILIGYMSWHLVEKYFLHRTSRQTKEV